MRLPKALSALGKSGFGLLLIGQAISLQGTWIQSTAQRWLVLELSDAPWILGLFGAVAGLPMLIFPYWAGWLSDRMDRMVLLISAQLIILLQAILFGLLVQTDSINIYWACILAFAMGSGMAFEVPSRQALVFELVGPKHITNALALHSTVFNLARFVGPAVAGLLMHAGMVAACFYIKAFTALAIIFILLILRKKIDTPLSATKQSQSQNLYKAFTEVLLFAKKHTIVGKILFTIITFSVLLLPYTILLPPFGRDILGLGAKEYGFLCAANGLGALLGAIFVAIFGHLGKREVWWRAGIIMFPLSLAILSLVNTYSLALITLIIAGFAMVITNTSAISLLQLSAKDRIRGQLMGLFTMSFMGLFPVGSILQGSLAQVAGIRFTLFSTSMLALITVIIYQKRLKKQKQIPS